jgi:hypothetical protein
MASCTQCSLTFNFATELWEHMKQLHSTKISLKFLSEPGSSVVIVRDPTSNKFTCPRCDKQFDRYQHMYNHSRRIPSNDASKDEAADTSNGSSTARAKEGVDSLITDCKEPSLPIDSYPANLDDVDMDAYLSPYQMTPPTTPKRTHSPADDFNDVDMGKFYSPYKVTPPKPIPCPSELASSDSEDSRPRYAAEKGKQKAIFSHCHSCQCHLPSLSTLWVK